ncbi:MAG: glycosyltransferase family 4 protein [Candidatus Saccharibacteria bacterium]
MKKVLFTATVDSHILAFHTPFLKYFKENGYEVHVATNGTENIPYCDKKHVISFERSPFKLNNLRAIRQLKKVVDAEHYDIIHTHTPMGGVVTRLAAIAARKKGTRVIYTAHGFHFFKGAPLINWLTYYPIEKLMSKYTDTLITINNEDYERAKSKFKTDIQYVPGVGIDPKKFDFKMSKSQKSELRQSLGLADDDFVMIYPAELNKNKNQLWLIKSIADLIKNNSKIHLLLPGVDSLNGKCQKLAIKLGIDKNIHFLGYRKDIPQLLKIADLSVSSSLREGLPVNIMEAAYLGLPIIATNCRGNRDIVADTNNGKLYDINDSDKIINEVFVVYSSIRHPYGNIAVTPQKNNIYSLYMIIYRMSEVYDHSVREANI